MCLPRALGWCTPTSCSAYGFLRTHSFPLPKKGPGNSDNHLAQKITCTNKGGRGQCLNQHNGPDSAPENGTHSVEQYVLYSSPRSKQKSGSSQDHLLALPLL